MLAGRGTSSRSGGPVEDPRGPVALRLLESLESAGIHCVYLRGYEGLPDRLGNDLDLLIPKGQSRGVISIIQDTASILGWVWIGTTRFAETAVYFAGPVSGCILHLDLYERFQWHTLEFADPEAVAGRRRWNGTVFVPDPTDELFLNVMERLIHQGKIRDHHREMASRILCEAGDGAVKQAFHRHLGSKGEELARTLICNQWTGTEKTRKQARFAALWHSAWKHPVRSCVHLGSYVLRVTGKLMHPPGRFFVFEGADGVGKSTMMESVVPWAAQACGGRTPRVFHWKPNRVMPWPPPESPAVDPRGTGPRGSLVSLVYLLYHYLGFWVGWSLRIYPQLVKGHLVVGDRYSYDLAIDPRRFRMTISPGLARFAAISVPQPHGVIGLIADPEVIHRRKPELEPAEIAGYQQRWIELASGNARMESIRADGPPDEVARAIRQALVRRLIASAGTPPRPLSP